MLKINKINKKDVLIFNIMFLITIIIFYNFVTMHYATDTYNIINMGYKEYAIKYLLNDGRPIMCFISLIANFLNLPIQVYIITLTIIALLISCISVMVVKKTIKKFLKIENKKNEIFLLLASYVTIFNFAYLDNLYFAECAVMAVSILLQLM